MFSPIVSLPLTCSPGSGLNASYCATSIWARFSNSVSSAAPPVAQLAGAVELAPLIVEAVADLVADHRADPAVVHRVVGFEVEERRLQDGGREDDLVVQRSCSRR